MRFYTTQLISSNLELTPEGFLLCKNVPIARTGVQLYLESELLNQENKPLVRGNADGIVRIERDPAVVFDDATIASFEGKPVTIDHPSSEVNPSNWNKLAKGVVQNVRRGDSIDDDYLIADLLITSADAIEQVREKGLREVSCGYDSGYEEIEPGRGRQTNIVGNHVALVEKGRCGSRCAIGDRAQRPTDVLCATGDSMKKNKVKFMDRVRAAFKNRDEAELEEALKESTSDEETETEEERKKREKKEAEDRKTADALADLTSRVKKLEKDSKSKDEETDEEKKEREEKEAKGKEKTSDSAALLAEAQDVRSRIEILAPGTKVPVHDAAADVKTVRDSHCALKRAALAAAFANPKTQDALTPLLAGVDLPKLSCDALHSTFVGASEIVRHTNNAQSKGTTDGAQAPLRAADSIAAMNRKNAEFWKRN